MCDKWAAYQFDAAVNLFGMVIENAAQEMHNVGSSKDAKWVAKYTMAQLLDPKFRLPTPPRQTNTAAAAFDSLRSLGVQVRHVKE